MTELEKKIYNKHLAISRSIRNKPFKIKKNFDGFEDDEKYSLIKRLSVFFMKYPEVDMDVYFSAPYKLYKDVDFFDLRYFSSPRAIKTYTIYKNELDKLSPDQHTEDVKKSLRFIAKFCIENNITLDKYICHKDIGIHYTWMYHLKHNFINIYSLMEFPNVLEQISELPEEEQILFLGKTYNDFFNYKTKYLNSKLRPTLILSFNKVRVFVEKTLTNQLKIQKNNI